MISYYYGDVDEHGRLIEHVTVARETDITPADLAKVRGVGSTVRIMATGIKWMYTASGWTIDNTQEGGGGGEPMEPLALADNTVQNTKLLAMAYLINNGLMDTSAVVDMDNFLRQAYISGVEYDLSKIDLTAARTMSGFFSGNDTLTELTADGIQDTSNVTDLSQLFAGCTRATRIDASAIKTDSAETLAYAFDGDAALAAVVLTGWDTSQCRKFEYMFRGCSHLTGIPTGDLITDNATSLTYMFSGCSRLTALDLSRWAVDNVTNFSYMLMGCTALSDLDMSEWNTGNGTTFAFFMADVHGLTDIDLSYLDTSKATTLADMFRITSAGDQTVTIKAPAGDDRSRAKATNAMFGAQGSYVACHVEEIWAPRCRSNNTQNMFSYCSRLHTLHLDGFDAHEATNTNNMFLGCSALVTITTDAQTVMPAINFTMADCPLTKQSAVNIFNALPTVTAARTVTLSAATKALLDETDIAIAVEKGWTVA